MKLQVIYHSLIILDYNEFQNFIDNSQKKELVTESQKKRILKPNSQNKDNIERTHKVFWALQKRHQEGLPPVTVDWRNKDIMVCQGVNKSSVRQKVDHFFKEYKKKKTQNPFNGYLTLTNTGTIVKTIINQKEPDIKNLSDKKEDYEKTYQNFRQKSQSRFSKQPEWKNNFLRLKDQVFNHKVVKSHNNSKIISGNNSPNNKTQVNNNIPSENNTKYDLKSFDRKIFVNPEKKRQIFGYNTVSSFNIKQSPSKHDNKFINKPLPKKTYDSNKGFSNSSINTKNQINNLTKAKDSAICAWENN